MPILDQIKHVSRRGWTGVHSAFWDILPMQNSTQVSLRPACQCVDIKTNAWVIPGFSVLPPDFPPFPFDHPDVYLSSSMSNAELKGLSQTTDPEKGLLDSQAVPYNGDVKAPLSTVSPAIPLTKEKDLAVTTTTKEVATKPSKPPSKPKKKVPLWIVWTLWFNTYRYILSIAIKADRYLALLFIRKFFTFCLTFNMIGLTLAASGHFPYGVTYDGAIVVANFNMAILMRNEVFGRLLYWLVNTLFAKVRTSFMA